MNWLKSYWLLLFLLPLAVTAQETETAASAVPSTTMLGTYYADKFVGRKTSCGDIFRQNQYTAAHRSIPLGTFLLVTNHSTDCQIVVRVNDRCPVRGVLDMTKLAVHQLGIKGSHKVEVRVLDEEEGRRRWATQDTLVMSEEEYYAFRDRSPRKRISPYPIRPGGNVPASKSRQPSPRPSAKQDAALAAAEQEPELQSDTVGSPVIVQSQPAVVIAKTNTPTAADTIDYDTLPLKDRRYDIELCTVSSHKAAMKEIGRLPKNLQNKVTLEYNQHTRQIRIILTVSDTRSRAVRTQSMLSDTFPESCLLLHKK